MGHPSNLGLGVDRWGSYAACPLVPKHGSRRDLGRHREHAEALGARLLNDRSHDQGEPLYVLADPAGHPFCLLVQ